MTARVSRLSQSLKHRCFSPCMLALSLTCCVEFCLSILCEPLLRERVKYHTHTLYTQASRLCITVITPQRMLGNLVKDVRNVNHLQSVLLSYWSTRPPPEELHWLLVQPSVSVSLMLFSCCSPEHNVLSHFLWRERGEVALTGLVRHFLKYSLKIWWKTRSAKFACSRPDSSLWAGRVFKSWKYSWTVQILC